jgi:hypothetical protein
MQLAQLRTPYVTANVDDTCEVSLINWLCIDPSIMAQYEKFGKKVTVQLNGETITGIESQFHINIQNWYGLLDFVIERHISFHMKLGRNFLAEIEPIYCIIEEPEVINLKDDVSLNMMESSEKYGNNY